MVSRYGFGLTSADVEQFGLDFNSESTQQLLQQLLEELQSEREAEEAAAAAAVGPNPLGGVVVTEEDEQVAMGVPTAEELAYWNYLMGAQGPPRSQHQYNYSPQGEHQTTLEAE